MPGISKNFTVYVWYNPAAGRWFAECPEIDYSASAFTFQALCPIIRDQAPRAAAAAGYITRNAEFYIARSVGRPMIPRWIQSV